MAKIRIVCLSEEASSLAVLANGCPFLTFAVFCWCPAPVCAITATELDKNPINKAQRSILGHTNGCILIMKVTAKKI